MSNITTREAGKGWNRQGGSAGSVDWRGKGLETAYYRLGVIGVSLLWASDTAGIGALQSAETVGKAGFEKGM